MKPMLKALASVLLKRRCDGPLSNFAFYFNLRRYTLGPVGGAGAAAAGKVRGRGLHSSTFRLNVSTFCGIRGVHGSPPVY